VAAVGWVLAPLFLLAWVSFVWRQVSAWRASAGFQRAQLKWLAAGSVVLVASCLAILMRGDGSSTGSRIAADLATLGIAVMPVAVGVAILRYRLYEIDRLISRTLSYALLTGLLVGVFAGLVLLTTRVLPFSSPVAVAASTLAAAALFNPLRSRVQRLVDRRFNRARYDREALVAMFGARLRDAVDSETVVTELAGAAARSVEPAHVSIWLRS
jgi:divalent metal cation (Fe/Co/Zn/Cd) transporter